MRSFASSSANQLTDKDFDVLQEWILISIVQFEKISLRLERLIQIQISDSKITIKEEYIENSILFIQRNRKRFQV